MLVPMTPADHDNSSSPRPPQPSATGSTVFLKGASAPPQDELTTAVGSGDGSDLDGDAAMLRLINLLNGERDRMLAEGRIRWPTEAVPKSAGSEDSAVLAIAVLACAGRARRAQRALYETLMQRLREKLAALEESTPPESCGVLAFNRVFARVSALIPEFDLVYAKDGGQRQYALTLETPAGPGLELSGLREGDWLHLTVDARNLRVLSFAAPAASAVRQGELWTNG